MMTRQVLVVVVMAIGQVLLVVLGVIGVGSLLRRVGEVGSPTGDRWVLYTTLHYTTLHYPGGRGYTSVGGTGAGVCARSGGRR